MDGSHSGEGVKTRLNDHLIEAANRHTVVRLPSSVFKPDAGPGINLLRFELGRADGGNASRTRSPGESPPTR